MSITTHSVTIIHLASQKVLLTLDGVESHTTIQTLKKKLCANDKKYKFDRISFRLSPRGKLLANTFCLSDIEEVGSEVRLFFKDLGPQMSWSNVFYLEYSGPLVFYSLVWAMRQPGSQLNVLDPMRTNLELRRLAGFCFVGHFAKRLLESYFVHRFSVASMPLTHLFRNCGYYWLFAIVIAYFTTHPLYTPPSFGWPQVYIGLTLFLLGELGNFCCHIALRDLRPVGSTLRQMPRPVPGSPLTFLFNYVACPNYTYETLSWIGFTVMTQTLPAAAFTVMGFLTMASWARKKLLAYRNEFASCPKGLKAIVPFFY